MSFIWNWNADKNHLRSDTNQLSPSPTPTPDLISISSHSEKGSLSPTKWNSSTSSRDDIRSSVIAEEIEWHEEDDEAYVDQGTYCHSSNQYEPTVATRATSFSNANEVPSSISSIHSYVPLLHSNLARRRNVGVEEETQPIPSEPRKPICNEPFCIKFRNFYHYVAQELRLTVEFMFEELCDLFPCCRERGKNSHR